MNTILPYPTIPVKKKYLTTAQAPDHFAATNRMRTVTPWVCNKLAAGPCPPGNS